MFGLYGTWMIVVPGEIPVTIAVVTRPTIKYVIETSRCFVFVKRSPILSTACHRPSRGIIRDEESEL